jgi:hypothetical protein
MAPRYDGEIPGKRVPEILTDHDDDRRQVPTFRRRRNQRTPYLPPDTTPLAGADGALVV